MSALRNSPFDKTQNVVSQNYTLDNENNFYVDINTINSNTERQLSRSEFNLDDSIIHHKMSRYKMTVLRFNLNHEPLPVFTYYPNKQYQIAVRHTTTGEFLIDDIETTKDHPYTDDRKDNLYSITQLLANINKTIADLFTALKVKEPTVITPTVPIKLYYDDNNKINYIIGEELLTSVSNRVEVIFSKDLAYHFKHLKYTQPFIDTNIFDDEGIIFKPVENVNKDQRIKKDEGLIVQYSSSKILNMISQFPNTKFITPVAKILLTGKLNNRSEIVINNDNVIKLKDYITDFIPDLTHVLQLNENIYYVNEDEKRYIDLTSSSELRSLIINFDYEDIYGNIKPIHLSPNQSFNIKLKFKLNKD
jgi:hypothetical protein